MNAAEPDIREFQPGDLPALQQMRAAAFAPVFASFRRIVGSEIAATVFEDADAEQAKLLDDICREGSAYQLLVVVSDGDILGFVSFAVDRDARIGEIGLNAVHPDHAGKGIGTALYTTALARMKSQGAQVATVGVGGDETHAAARRAYAKAGFGPAITSLHLYRLL